MTLIDKIRFRRMDMKTTGMTRPVDQLGRVVIPKEIRNELNVAEGDRLEIWMDGDTVLMRKYEPHCVFCEETEDLIEFEGRLICKKCASKIAKEANK